MMDVEKILVNEDSHGERLDVLLAGRLAAHFSRSQIKKHIEGGFVHIKGKDVTAHYKVKSGDQIEVEWVDKPDNGLRAEDIPINILYEDDHLVIVEKPAGMVVHPAHGNPNHTLVNALLHHFQKLSTSAGITRPGLVHRLDKDTSGVMVIAKNDFAHAHLANQFKNHTIKKVYYAFVRGVVEHNEGICEEAVGRAFLNRKKVMIKPAGGKEAETFFRVKKRYADATWVEVHPRTGRTHQIRVHMTHLGHSILGDELYGFPCAGINRQALHAYSLTFTHHVTKKELSFQVPLPKDMQDLVFWLEAGQDK